MLSRQPKWIRPCPAQGDRVGYASHRKAIVTLSNGRTYLFDGARASREALAGEELLVIATDPGERWVTLRGRESLYRLDLMDGALDQVEAPPIVGLLSDKALTLFVGDDRMLYSLAAGSIVPTPEFPRSGGSPPRAWTTSEGGASWKVSGIMSHSVWRLTSATPGSGPRAASSFASQKPRGSRCSALTSISPAGPGCGRSIASTSRRTEAPLLRLRSPPPHRTARPCSTRSLPRRRGPWALSTWPPAT